MIPLLCGMQRVCSYCYIITYFYVIITKDSIITHCYIFQSPELADESDSSITLYKVHNKDSRIFH